MFTGKFILLEISNYEGVYYIVNLTKGYFCTAKIEACNRLIEFLNVPSLCYLNSKNTKKYLALDMYSLDTSSILKNSWLAGMTDTDGNFNVIICKPENKKSMGIQTQYTLELRKKYHRCWLITTSYFDIMTIISKGFNTNLYKPSRKLNDTVCMSLICHYRWFDYF